MGAKLVPRQVPSLFLPQGSLLSADMAESSPLPSSPAAAPAAEPGVTEQPGPQSPPPSPPGPEEPLDGVDPDVPHPDLAPVAFFCLRQTTSPRNWCIKMVCNPYPLYGLGLSGSCPGPRCSLWSGGLRLQGSGGGEPTLVLGPGTPRSGRGARMREDLASC